MNNDMVTFVRARLDEDEQGASAASPGPWHLNAEGDEVLAVDDITVAEGFALSNRQLRATAAHIARHDPARVLREVDAKRRIVDLHGIVYREIGWLENGDEERSETPVCGLCAPKHSHYQRRDDVPKGPCLTVRLHAAAYADHPDYRKEWRP
ncbi:DUF6221 family protein [Streptomyces sp. NPDC051569]|uniref:DUF6221 family protein n=1 Tax=Streptomyces sp. NPDC051569 TaxID=3365661 RepID=UPI0037BA77D0